MSISQKLILIVLFSLALAGCEGKITYSYLMQHPDVLKREIVACQAGGEKTREPTSRCEMVMYAAENMFIFVSQLQENPEKFGEHVMEAQANYVKANYELHAAQKALADLQNKKAPAPEVTAAEEKVEKAKKVVAEKNEEIEVLWAVLGLTSPE